MAAMGPSPLGGLGKSGDPPPPPEGEVFRTDLQPTYHPNGPLWGIELFLAPSPKPNQSAPKRTKWSVMDSSLQAKGEQSTPQATG